MAKDQAAQKMLEILKYFTYYLRFLFFSIISIYLFYSGITEVILEPAVDTSSKKDLLARLSERHPNASDQKSEVSTGIPGFKIFFVSCLVDGSKTSGRIY